MTSLTTPTIEARELAMTIRAGETQRRVHLVENADLTVILERGQKDIECDRVPNGINDTGLVVISLGVDGGDHDEVHYERGHWLGEPTDTLELLGQAIETLTECAGALTRIKFT